MTAQTKLWIDMTKQEKNAALAAMMGWPLDWLYLDYRRTALTTDYTACFEGPVKWALEQGYTVEILARNDIAKVTVWPGRVISVDGYSPDAICEAIWKAQKEKP